MFLFLWEAMFYLSMGAAIFPRSRKYGGPKKWRLFGRRRWRREWERVQLAPLGRCGAVQFNCIGGGAFRNTSYFTLSRLEIPYMYIV